MQLCCKNCGREIPAGDINLDRMVAKCDSCNAIFSFADQFNYAPTPADSYHKWNIDTPKNFTVENQAGELKLTRKWFGPIVFVMGFFALFWNAISLPIFGVMLWQRQWFPACFVSIHATVGLFLAYYTLCLVVNSTWVTVGQGRLQVRHGPLPWWGNRELPAGEISQVYCQERRGRKGSRSYEVQVMTPADKKISLVSALPQPEEALFLEQEIERFLGVQDRRVPGEYQY